MGSSTADLNMIKQIQPVVSGLGTILGGIGAVMTVIGALATIKL
ncbi:hypothetical protein M2284_001258 [Rhodococcus sp. LBL1]|nr:hypothetical protein [Rhodococcus sp. LBL1]MDH6682647.1 hypothetical protein [Rhodococcus sp. LBL2]